jgi:hypothetical protein
MRIRAMTAVVTAIFLAGATAAMAQAPAASPEGATAPQAAPGKSTAGQGATAAPVTRPSSTEKSQAAVPDSSLAPRSPNVPK